MGFTNDRHDYRRPVSTRPGLPATELPTPNVEDLIIVENFAVSVDAYAPLLRGTPHPSNAAALLVFEKASPGNNNERQVQRIYATTRSAQDAYNASIKFTEESASSPVFIRSYVLSRPVAYGTRNAPLSSLIGLTLTAGGSGYTHAPAVSFSEGGGSGAEGRVEVVNGVVKSIWLMDGGTGFTSAPTVVFSSAGDTATATATLAATSVGQVAVDDPGLGYDGSATVIFTGGGGVGAAAQVDVAMDGSIQGISLVDIGYGAGGTGYTSAPSITFGGGVPTSPASAHAVLSASPVESITVTDGGSLYTSAPNVTIGGDGTGATATATVAGGVVTAVNVTNGGVEYVSETTTITFSGGHAGTGAAATALIQPQAAVLTHEEIQPAEGEIGSLFDRVTRVYTTLDGPVVTEITSGHGGLFTKTTRQLVAPGTLPATPGGVELSESVRQVSTTEAERVTETMVDSAGNDAAGFPIYQTQKMHDETGVVIFTDHFIAIPSYSLPPTYVGGTRALITAFYANWKQPNANPAVGYSSTPYSPKHYVIDARAQSVGNTSDKLMVEIDHAIIPLPRLEVKEIGYTFPAILYLNQDDYSVPNNYGGKYPPPWPIGEDQVAGFRLVAARPSRRIAVTYITYTLGPTKNLPPTFDITTPGTSSRYYRGLIRENTIHPAIFVQEVLDDGTSVVTEDIPASTPAFYDPNDILCIAASEKRLWGEIYEKRVTYISEGTPPSAFPDPAIVGYGTQFAFFKGTSAITLDAPLKGAKVLASVSTGTASIKLYGRQNPADSGVSADETMSLTTSTSVSINGYQRLTEVLVNPPVAGIVTLSESVDPDTGSMLFAAQPDDGDKLKVGKVGSEVIYIYRSTLVTGAIGSVTLTAPGSGFTDVPTASFGGGGTGATATVALTPTSVASGAVDVGGTGYGTVPTVSVTGGGGTGATFTAVLTGNLVTSLTRTAAGSGYTSRPTLTIVPSGGGGSGATAHSVLTGTSVASITLGAGGSGYSSPTVTIAGTGGSGATATATVEAQTIKIGSSLAITAAHTVKAIMGASLGTAVGAGLTPHPDLTATIDAGNAKLVNFASSSPTVTGASWTLAIYDNDGTTPENFATLYAFVDGFIGGTICVIPAGSSIAYWRADFATNKALVNETNDDDSTAIPSLPADVVFYTDWMEIPSDREITLLYGASGNRPLRVAWQANSTGTAPTPSTISVAVTNNSTAVSSGLVLGDAGKEILIVGDTVPNEVVNATTLLRAYTGTTGTKSASLTGLVATTIANAATGKVRRVSIGTPATKFLRLKLTRTGTAPLQYQPVFARASWIYTPNDS